MRKCSLWQLMMIIVAVSLLTSGLSGCGGGGSSGGNGGQDTDTGSVTGRVLHFTTDVGLGGVTVTVGGRSAVSDSNGYFTITGIAPGTGQLLTVTPPAWLSMPSIEPITVNVYADQTTTLPAAIRLIDTGEAPPQPPYTP